MPESPLRLPYGRTRGKVYKKAAKWAAGERLNWRGRRDSYSYNLRRLSKLLKTRYAKTSKTSTLGW